MVSIVWFRRDLRLADNPALDAALRAGGAVVPLYIHDDADAGEWTMGGASRWWLHHSLAALAQDLERLGARLLLRRGRAAEVLEGLAAETGAQAVYWNRRYEPWVRTRDEAIKAALKSRAIQARSFNGALLREPWEVSTGQGGPYRVFTPFWKALRSMGDPSPGSPRPAHVPMPPAVPAGDRLDDWGLLPRTPDWSHGLRHSWQPGERGASARLDAFLDGAVAAYDSRRDVPGAEGTSRLSPHLHFGEIAPGRIWRACRERALHRTGGAMPRPVEVYLSEIAWREFSYHLLYHFPDLPGRPWRSEFERFAWADDPAALTAWQRGRTGYPIVDAGMRELWHTGWQHNRVRMIAASFLIKDLLIHWRQGARWFWDTLVDADLASNSASWQWVAGCGADAAPYFRVFNPVTQAAKFDPEGAYVRRWVPELARLPDGLIHAPWTARPIDLADAGVVPGKTYPNPIVDHAAARDRALAAFQALKTQNQD